MAPTGMYLKYVFFHILPIVHEGEIPRNPVVFKQQADYAMPGLNVLHIPMCFNLPSQLVALLSRVARASCPVC